MLNTKKGGKDLLERPVNKKEVLSLLSVRSHVGQVGKHESSRCCCCCCIPVVSISPDCVLNQLERIFEGPLIYKNTSSSESILAGEDLINPALPVQCEATWESSSLNHKKRLCSNNNIGVPFPICPSIRRRISRRPHKLMRKLHIHLVSQSWWASSQSIATPWTTTSENIPWISISLLVHQFSEGNEYDFSKQIQ